MRPGADTPPQRTRSAGAHTVVAVVEAVAVAATVAWLAWRADTTPPSTLWLDDAWLALATRATNAGDLLMTGATAPGFAVVLRAVHEATGAVEALVHVALAAGLALPVAVYAAGRRALRLSAPAALLAAVIVASNGVVATYASRVKPFTADALLATAVLAAGALVVRDPAERRRWWLLSAVALGALFVSGATAFTAVAAGAAGLIAGRGRALRAAALPVALAAAVASVWYLAVLRPAQTDALRDYWSEYTSLGHAGDLGADLLAVPGPLALALLAAAAAATAAAKATATAARGRPALALLGLPAVLVAAAAAAGVVPLGGGRTDAHLYPSLALLVATGWEHLTRGRPRTRLAGAALVAASLVAAAPSPEPYPAEDVRPLVAAAERRAAPTDAIVVYPAARWAYSLYTSGDITLVRDGASANGFDVRPRHPAVHVLPPARDDPARHRPAVERATSGADRVWLVASHAAGDLAAIEEALAGLGFAMRESATRPGASLTVWAR